MEQVNRASTAIRGADGRAIRDVAWLVAASVLVTALAVGTHAFDHLLDWSQHFGAWNADLVLTVVVIAPVAAALFAFRRYQDAASVRHELAVLSLHDSLTGLPNRLFLGDWLRQGLKESRRANARVAVLFLDLDRFKMVNDTYGHEVGDRLMVAVAGRLRATVRPEDRVIRYGGDEFVAICSGMSSTSEAERIATRLIAALETPFEMGQDSIRISTSIGLALSEEQCANPEEVIRDADLAMYQAKLQGAGTFATFDRSMRSMLSRATVETRMHTAVERGEFLLYYQPVVAVADGSLVGVEALLRWLDPDRGLVEPREFVPALEDTGLIVPVGAWALEEACRQARRWQEGWPDRPGLKVTVNVSARQLAQANFREVVSGVLERTGAARSQLCLEITEGALMYDVASAWAMLRHAKSLGVQLALDDFGTGYSSLSYVRRFNLDMLKIDRSFVADLGESREDTAIVEHVIGMAKALGMVTVAEGVENARQLAELRRLNCDLAQGFYFSAAQPPEAIDELLAASRLCTA